MFSEKYDSIYNDVKWPGILVLTNTIIIHLEMVLSPRFGLKLGLKL